MKRNKFWAAGALLLACVGRPVSADDVRYYDDNGITYRETKQTVRRAVPHTKMEPREGVYYRERVTTDLQDVQRAYQVPITEYQWQPEVQNRWNPFAQPVVTYRMVQKTRWETKVETVKIPVSKREVVPEKYTQQVPVTSHLMAEESVVSRVAVGPTSANSAAMTANLSRSDSNTASSTNNYSSDAVGGVSKLDNGLPKQNPDWRSGDSTLRR